MMGRTRNKIVVFDGSNRHRGELMDVKITRGFVHASRRSGNCEPVRPGVADPFIKKFSMPGTCSTFRRLIRIVNEFT
jgi:hypothetical protein